MKIKAFIFVLIAITLLFSIPAVPAAASSPAKTTCTLYHKVERGDYLVSIAKEYDTTWRWLADYNNISNPSRIFPGQMLCVEASETPVCTEQYVVKSGDYLSKIARVYDVPWKWLAEINDLKSPYTIHPGEKLCVAMEPGDDDDDTATPTPDPDDNEDEVVPTFAITGVVEDESVTIKTRDFPANDRFNVLIGKMGTRGVKGIKVDTIGSGKGGSFSATFDIPEDLQGERLLSIRLESPTSGYYSYNWFYND